MILLLAQEEAPNFFRFLPLLAMAGLILFRWLSGKIKKKEQEQRAEEEERYQQEHPEAAPRRAGPVQTSSHRVPAPPQRSQPAEQIHRYEPRIPDSPAPPDWRRRQQPEAKQIVLAQDITAVPLDRQPGQEQRQQQLRIQAAQRAKALKIKNQRRQQAAELRATQAAQKAAAQREDSRSLHDGDLSTTQPIPVPTDILPPVEITLSRAQLRQAVVWAEILSSPRGLREYSPSF